MTKQHLSTLLLLLVSWKAIVVDQSANVIDGAKLSSRNYIHLTDRRQTYLWVQQNLFKKVFLFFSLSTECCFRTSNMVYHPHLHYAKNISKILPS